MSTTRATAWMVAAVAGMAASVAQAGPTFTITPLVLEGDSVDGVGLVTSIASVAVNDNGDWIVEADTDQANTDTDGVVIKNGVLFLREGEALAAPAGASVDAFDSVRLNRQGDTGWNLTLDGTSGSSDDSGLFFNDTLILQEGAVFTGAGLSPGTPYIGFFEARMNDSNDLLVVASVDDPEIATTVDRALVVLSYDPGAGTYTETLIAAEGGVLPGVAEPILDFGTSPEEFAFNNNGDAIFQTDVDSSTATDLTVYLALSGQDPVLLAREGSASPVAGRNWLSLSTLGVDLNDSGDYVYTGDLDGDSATNRVIIRNGALFAQEGDEPPGITGFAITSFGVAPIVQISNAGSVLWYADWDDDTSRDTGLFLDQTLLVQEGVTEIDGVLMGAINSAEDGYMMSNNGRYIIFEATLADGRNGAFLIEFAGDDCAADCTGEGDLTAADFACFRTAFLTGDDYADFNGDGDLTPADFSAYRNAFLAGCP